MAHSGLFGRDAELEKILSYIDAERAHRVFILSGPVGSGRTTLIREALRKRRDAIRYFIDFSPASKPLGIDGVLEEALCHGREEECLHRVIHDSIRRADGTTRKIIIAVDGVYCIQGVHGECETPFMVRSLARLVEAYSERFRVILSIDDQETMLELGRVAEYIDILVVEGLPEDAARRFAEMQAREVGIPLDEDTLSDIVAATGGLPLHMLIIIHEYRGNVGEWARDAESKLKWKLALIASQLGVNLREAAKAILDLIDRPLTSIPRHAYSVLRAALRNNIVYLSRGEVVKLQLPVYRGMLHRVAYTY